MSLEPWNLESRYAPPTCSVKTVAGKSDILEMINIVNSALASLENFKIFKREYALFSLFLYKYKRVFRHDRGVRLMAQINQALFKGRSLGMIKAMEKMKFCFPATISSERDEYYLPTQQMLKWLLLRIMGNAKVFARLIELCEESNAYISGRVANEKRSDFMLFAAALISRVYCCSKYFLMKVTEWYNKLRVLLPVLTDTVDFLKNYEFPKAMEDFIGPVDMNPRGYRPDIEEVFEMIDLTKNDDSDKEENIEFDNNDETDNSDKDSESEFNPKKKRKIIKVLQSDSDSESKEDIPKKKKKRRVIRPRDSESESDVVVVYENLKMQPKKSIHSLAHFEDLGEPVPRESIQMKKA